MSVFIVILNILTISKLRFTVVLFGGLIMQSEHSIQREIQVALSRKGYKVFRANVGSVHTSDGRFFKTGLPSGFFDLFGFRPEDGKIFFIEVKNETGKARPDQIRFHEMLQDNYIIHGLCRSAVEAVAVVEEKLIGYGFNG